MLAYRLRGLSTMFSQPRLPEFIERVPFPHPTSNGTAHYVPIVKTMPGELKALQYVPARDRVRMTPLIEVEVQALDGSLTPRSNPLTRLPQQLAMILGAHPFFLDLGGVKPGQEINVRPYKLLLRVPAIDYIVAECAKRNLSFVPVVRPGMDSDVVALLRS